MECKTLGECLTSVIDHRGLTPKKLGGDWAADGYRAVSAKNIKNGRLVQQESMNRVSLDMYRQWMPEEIERGDILITSEAPFGETMYWDSSEKLVLSQRVFGLKADSAVCNARYLYYWMIGPAFQSELRGRATGTTVIGLRQPELLKCLVKLPDISTQKRIASLLATLDSKINLNNQINDYLEECCQALFDDIQSDHTNGVIQLSDVAAVNPKRRLSKGSLARCVEMSNLSTRGAFPNDWCRKAYNGGMKFMNGDTILARITPCLENGKTAYINFLDDGEVAFGSTEYIVLASEGLLPTEFFYFLARNRAFVSYATNHMNGSSGRQRVSAGDIETYRLRVPSSDQAVRFANFAQPAMEEILKHSLENRRLSSLRDALLPKLMSGEIDVSKVELPTPPNNHLPLD